MKLKVGPIVKMSHPFKIHKTRTLTSNGWNLLEYQNAKSKKSYICKTNPKLTKQMGVPVTPFLT